MDYRALVEQGIARLRTGRLHEAEDLFAQAVTINPGDAGSWNVLALIALQTARPDAALERATRAHELDRKHADYLNTIGLAHGERGDLPSAEAALRRALKSRPDSAELHYNLGRTLHRQGRTLDALAAFKRASGIDPRYPGALNNQAGTLFELGRTAEARVVMEQAADADPSDELALDNLANVLFKTEGPGAVREMFRARLSRYPHLQQARFSYAATLLGDGEFSEGWDQYHRCVRGRIVSEADRVDRLPDDLRGRSVLLRKEQGLGDVLFFLRFASRLRERGASLTLESPTKLLALLEHHAMFQRVIPEAGRGRPAGYDLVLHLGDLPALVGGDPAGADFPIAPDAGRMTELASVLSGTGPGPYVAVTWRAGIAKHDTFMRAAELSFSKDVPLEQIADALAGINATPVVVQREPASGELEHLRRILGRPVCDLSRLNDDLPGMAALLGLIDEYVGVSNTNMHIRRAIGRGARVLVPYPAEWRWMFEGESPWFPDFAVYRQAPGNDWSDALTRLRTDLRGMTGAS